MRLFSFLKKENNHPIPPYLKSQIKSKDLMPQNYPTNIYPITRYYQYKHGAYSYNGEPPGIPKWLGSFDYLIGWSYGFANKKVYPHSVFCHPHYLVHFLNFMEKNFKSKPSEIKNNYIAIGGEDNLLSTFPNEIFKKLSIFFDQIFFEGFDDIQKYNCDIMPIGLTEYYLRGEETSFRNISKNTIKQKLLLCSFGAQWPILNRTIDDRKSAIRFSKSSKLCSYRVLKRRNYYRELANHKFSICPLGNGHQSPKFAESIIFRCIPIMTLSKCSMALKKKGLPLVIVNKWEDINEKFLNEEYEAKKNQINYFSKVYSDLDKFRCFCFNQ